MRDVGWQRSLQRTQRGWGVAETPAPLSTTLTGPAEAGRSELIATVLCEHVTDSFFQVAGITGVFQRAQVD